MKYLSAIVIFTIVFVYGCDNPADMNRTGDKLSGYITHFDTNVIITSNGFYSISVFSADSTNPFFRVPLRTDSLNLKRRQDRLVYESLYDMDGIPSGNYYIAATWSSYPRVPNEIPKVLGTYGCDTSYSCTNHTLVVYPNFEGHFRNITSWSDTLKRLN